MGVAGSSYVLCGTVVPQFDPDQRIELFRKSMIDSDTREPIVGCEVWRLESPSGPIVAAINSQASRFRCERGIQYILVAPPEPDAAN